MKFLIVLLAIFAVAHSVDYNELIKKIQTQVKKGDTSSEEIEELVHGELKEITQQLDLQICGKKHSNKLHEAVLKSIECVKDIKLNDQLICDVVTTTFKKCIKPIEQRFESCLQGEFHDLPKLFVDSIYSTAKYICDSQVRDIVELTNPCFMEVVEDVEKCTKNFKGLVDNLRPNGNLKTSFCKELTSQRECFITQVSKHCKNEFTKKAYSAFYDASVITPCAS